MAKGPTFDTITAAFASASLLNANFASIVTSFNNTISRDGSTPNQMLADFDMNNNDILNVNDIAACKLTLDGTVVTALVSQGTPKFKGVRVYQTSGTALTNTSADILFDTEEHDTDNLHSITSNTGRLVADVAGYWEATAQLAFGVAKGYTAIGVVIFKNGTDLIAANEAVYGASPGNSLPDKQCSTGPILLAAGDYLIAQGSVVPSTTSRTEASNTWFEMHLVGLV